MTEESKSDRRRSPRIPVSLSATYRSTRRTVDARVSNLSQAGLFLSCREVDVRGTKVDVELALPGQGTPFVLAGTVAWACDEGMGIRFATITREQRRALANFIMGQVASTY